jgi:hypothetical protein
LTAAVFLAAGGCELRNPTVGHFHRVDRLHATSLALHYRNCEAILFASSVIGPAATDRCGAAAGPQQSYEQLAPARTVNALTSTFLAPLAQLAL